MKRLKRLILAFLLLCGLLPAQSRLSYDDPYHDYLLFLGTGEGITKSATWNLQNLLPDPANFTLTVMHVAVTPASKNGLGLVYVGFRDWQNNFLTHVISCWSTVGYGKITNPGAGGTAGQFMQPRADTISPKQFKILNDRFYMTGESVEGGALLRLEHPYYRDYCLPIFGAVDLLTQNATWVQGWLGFSGQELTTTSVTEVDLFKVDLSRVRALTKISQRIEYYCTASLTGSELKIYYSQDGVLWTQVFIHQGLPTLSSSTEVGVNFDPPMNVRYIKGTGKSDGTAIVKLTPFKLFCWG